MHRALLPVLIAGLVGLGLAADPAAAVTIELRSLPELASAAERITQGRVLAERVEADAAGLIWTTYTFQVEEELKDPAVTPGAVFEFRQLGGTLDGETLLAVGFPYFAVGEDCLLFLHGDGVSQRVLNAWQGALRIDESPSLDGGRTLRRLLGVAGHFRERCSSDLDEFKTEVRAALEGGRP